MARPLPLNPSFLPPTYGVLKSLLENPLKLPLHHEDAFYKEKDKDKKLDDDSTSATVPQSAFLGPTLWDKTLPYDGDTFQLEYMDLEEFLSENGIPPSPVQHDHSPHQPALQQPTSASTPVMDLSHRASTSVHPTMVSQNCMQNTPRPGGVNHLQALLPSRPCFLNCSCLLAALHMDTLGTGSHCSSASLMSDSRGSKELPDGLGPLSAFNSEPLSEPSLDSRIGPRSSPTSSLSESAASSA